MSTEMADLFSISVGIMAFALCIWTLVLIIYSLELARRRRILVEERQELRRWYRLKGLGEEQNSKWS